jgi:hypothetical protein
VHDARAAASAFFTGRHGIMGAYPPDRELRYHFFPEILVTALFD